MRIHLRVLDQLFTNWTSKLSVLILNSILQREQKIILILKIYEIKNKILISFFF